MGTQGNEQASPGKDSHNYKVFKFADSTDYSSEILLYKYAYLLFVLFSYHYSQSKALYQQFILHGILITQRGLTLYRKVCRAHMHKLQHFIRGSEYLAVS